MLSLAMLILCYNNQDSEQHIKEIVESQQNVLLLDSNGIELGLFLVVYY